MKPAKNIAAKFWILIPAITLTVMTAVSPAGAEEKPATSTTSGEKDIAAPCRRRAMEYTIIISQFTLWVQASTWTRVSQKKSFSRQ